MAGRPLVFKDDVYAVASLHDGLVYVPLREVAKGAPHGLNPDGLAARLHLADPKEVFVDYVDPREVEGIEHLGQKWLASADGREDFMVFDDEPSAWKYLQAMHPELKVAKALRAAAEALLEAKGIGFAKTFKSAVDAYLAGGPEEDMIMALKAFMALFSPKTGQGPIGKAYSLDAPWIMALSEIKKKKLRRAFFTADNEVELLKLDQQKSEADPERYEKYKMGTRQMKESILRDLEKVAKQVDLLAGAEQEGGFEHGKFTIKVLPGVTRKQVEAALGALDKVSAAIAKKFPQVLYGEIYMSPKVGGHKTAAHYIPVDDVIHISPKHISSTDGFDIHALAHEFGHRYDHKFADKALRKEFTRLSIEPSDTEYVYDEALRKKVADELVSVVNIQKMGMGSVSQKLYSPQMEAWISSPSGVQPFIKDFVSQYMRGTIDEEKLRFAAMGNGHRDRTVTLRVGKPLAVSDYGKTSPGENFAEAFAFYVLGKWMPEPLQAILEQMR